MLYFVQCDPLWEQFGHRNKASESESLAISSCSWVKYTEESQLESEKIPCPDFGVGCEV